MQVGKAAVVVVIVVTKFSCKILAAAAARACEQRRGLRGGRPRSLTAWSKGGAAAVGIHLEGGGEGTQQSCRIFPSLYTENTPKRGIQSTRKTSEDHKKLTSKKWRAW